MPASQCRISAVGNAAWAWSERRAAGQYYLEITNSYGTGSIVIHPKVGLQAASGQRIVRIIEAHQGCWRFRAGGEISVSSVFAGDMEE